MLNSAHLWMGKEEKPVFCMGLWTEFSVVKLAILTWRPVGIYLLLEPASSGHLKKSRLCNCWLHFPGLEVPTWCYYFLCCYDIALPALKIHRFVGFEKKHHVDFSTTCSALEWSVAFPYSTVMQLWVTCSTTSEITFLLTVEGNK